MSWFGKKEEPPQTIGTRNRPDRMRLARVRAEAWVLEQVHAKYKGGAEAFSRDLVSDPTGAVLGGFDALQRESFLQSHEDFLRTCWSKLSEDDKFDLISQLGWCVGRYERKLEELGIDTAALLKT